MGSSIDFKKAPALTGAYLLFLHIHYLYKLLIVGNSVRVYAVVLVT
jgi:hypothetical protein